MTKKTTKIISLLIVGITFFSSFCMFIELPTVKAYTEDVDNPNTCNLGEVFVEHKRGDTFLTYTMTGNFTEENDKDFMITEWNDPDPNVEGWVYDPYFDYYIYYWDIKEINGTADGFNGKMYYLNGTIANDNLYEQYQFIDSNSPAIPNAFYSKVYPSMCGVEGVPDNDNTWYDQDQCLFVPWTMTFRSPYLIHSITGEDIGLHSGIGSFTFAWTLYTEEQFNGSVYYNLQPIISLDSEHYSQANTRIEYTTDNVHWYESSYDSITLDDYQYKVKVYDTATNDLIYADSSFVNYTRHRSIEIDSIKLINNAGEPVIFHVSNRTTTYQNTTYYNTAELVSMFTGTKNSSDYSCMDAEDFNSLLLEPIGTGQAVYDTHTENWYADWDTMLNGTRSGVYANLEDIDSSYWELNSNTESTISDYELEYLFAFPSWTGMYYNLGATTTTTYGQFNGQIANDDNNYFHSDSEITSQSISSYNYHTENYYPHSATYTNGSLYDGSIPDSIDTDDSDYLEIDSNIVSYLNGDYVDYNYTGSADSASWDSGTPTGSLSNLESNDDSNYEIECDTASGETVMAFGYIPYESFNWASDIGTNEWTLSSGTDHYLAGEWGSSTFTLNTNGAGQDGATEQIGFPSSHTGGFNSDDEVVSFRMAFRSASWDYLNEWVDFRFYIDGNYSVSTELWMLQSANPQTYQYYFDCDYLFGRNFTVSEFVDSSNFLEFTKNGDSFWLMYYFEILDVTVKTSKDVSGIYGTNVISTDYYHGVIDTSEEYYINSDGVTTNLHTTGDFGTHWEHFDDGTVTTYVYGDSTDDGQYDEYGVYDVSNWLDKDSNYINVFSEDYWGIDEDLSLYQIQSITLDMDVYATSYTNNYGQLTFSLDGGSSWETYKDVKATSNSVWRNNVDVTWDISAQNLTMEVYDDLIIRLRVQTTIGNQVRFSQLWVKEVSWYSYSSSSYQYDTSGYIEFDYSDLGSSGNITDRSDITDIGLNYRFYSNVSQQIDIYAYDWDSSTWDILTSTSPISETAYANYSLGVEYLQNNINDLLFRFLVNGTSNSAPFETYFDLVTLELQYENQHDPYYDSYYGMDFILEWDLGNLIDIGNMTTKGDLSATAMDVTKLAWDWGGDASDTITISYWNYDLANWDIDQDTITMSTYTTFASSLDITDRLDNTDLWSADLICKMRFQIEDDSEGETGFVLEEHILSNSSCRIYLDLTELEFQYENHNDPNYDRTHEISGYFQWDLSQLYTDGNITTRDDIESFTFNWIWNTNVSNTVYWSFYNWDGSSWTAILNDATITETEDNELLANINGIDSSNYLIRLAFNTSYDQLDERDSSGISLDVEYIGSNVVYQNRHLPVYDWYNYISGYVEIDLSNLFILGNLTDTSQITDTELSYNWKTNVSESCSFHAWDFTASDWDLIASDTQTAYATDTTQIYDTVADYIDSITHTSRFSYNISYLYENHTTNQDIELSFDLIQLEIDYQNQREEYYNWNLSYQIEWDYDEISSFFSWDWVNHTNMIYEYYFNTTVDYVDIEFKYNDTAFTTYHNGIYTTMTQIQNLSQPIDYFNNTLKFIMDVNVSLYSHWYEPFEMIMDYANMSVFFSNISIPVYSYEGTRDFLVVPYDYALHNIDDSTFPSGSGTQADPYINQTYNVTDIYGNYLENDIVIPDFTDYIEVNYTAPQMRTCLISYSDQRGNYLDFLQYKTKINGTTIYEQYFYAEVSDWVNISVYDRFDNFITSSGYTVKRDDNWISILLTLHSLKIYNQQIEFAWFNLTENPATDYYWSEWLAPNEITEFKLLAGNYVINVTEYENSTSHQYAYTLAGDDILIIDSGFTIQQAIWNIQNVNTTIGNQITAVNITISNEMSSIENQTILIDFNLGNVNTTIGNLLTAQNTTISAIYSNITTLYTYQQNQFTILDNNINFTFTELNSSIFLVNNSIYTAINSLDTSLTLTNNTIMGNLTTILTMNEYLTQLYQNTMFSDLINWTDAYRNSTFIENQIDTWTFVNNFKNDSLRIYFQYQDLTESIIIASQTTTEYILPKENVNYRVTSLATGEELQSWDALDNASLKLEFGFYEEDIRLSDIQIEYNEWLATVLLAGSFIIVVIILFGVAKRRYEQQSEREYRERKTKPDRLQKTKVRDTTNVFFN